MISDEQFKRGFRRLASGVSCVTTKWEEQCYGFAATSVTSLTNSPPTLLVCVDKSTSNFESIKASGIFCINVLRYDDCDTASLFADKSRRDSRFLDRSWIELKTGVPVLADALVAFDCRIEQSHSYGTHNIFIATIVDALINDVLEKPLLYFDGLYCEVAEATQR